MLELEVLDSEQPEEAARKAETVAAIVQAAFEAQAKMLGMDCEKHPFYAAFETARMVLDRMERGEKVILAWLDGTAVGTVRYALDAEDACRGWIHRLAVLPEHRGNGFGDELMAFAEKRLRELGAKTAHLALMAQFGGLQRYYESHAYCAYEQKKFDAVPFDTLFMRKTLGDCGHTTDSAKISTGHDRITNKPIASKGRAD